MPLCCSFLSFPSSRTPVSRRHLAVVAVPRVECVRARSSVHHRVLFESVRAGFANQGGPRTSSNVGAQDVGHVFVASADRTVGKPCARFVRGQGLNRNLLSLCSAKYPRARPRALGEFGEARAEKFGDLSRPTITMYRPHRRSYASTATVRAI